MSTQQPSTPPGPPPGWYPDPNGQQVLRWWDGRQWGPHTQPLPAAPPEAAGRHHAPGAAGSAPSGGEPDDELPPTAAPVAKPQLPAPYGQDQPPYPPGPPQRPPMPRRRRIGWAVIAGAGALFIVLVIVAAVQGAHSSGSTPAQDAAGSPSAGAPPSSSALAAPSPSSSPPPCLTHSCIVSVIEQTLPGTEAKDGSVMTKAVCYKSTVKSNPGGTYTASCDVSYSDGEVWSGYATLLVAQQQVSWEPEQEVQ